MSLETAVARIDEIRTMLVARGGRDAARRRPPTAAPGVRRRARDALTTSALAYSACDLGARRHDARRRPGDGKYDDRIQASAAREGVDPALVRAIVAHESGFNANATSSAGAQGLMQLMPATARGLGVTNSYDPAQNIAGGTHLIRTLLDRYDGDLSLALAAYSAGPGAVARYGGIPPYGETQAYVRDVTASYQRTTSERNTGMNPLILVAPAAEVTRRPTGDPPGDPPGDFAPVIGAALAQGAQAPPKGSADGARTATAEGADPETADGGTGQAETAADAEPAAPGDAEPAARRAPTAETALPSSRLGSRRRAGRRPPAPAAAELAPRRAQPQQPARRRAAPAGRGSRAGRHAPRRAGQGAARLRLQRPARPFPRRPRRPRPHPRRRRHRAARGRARGPAAGR